MRPVCPSCPVDRIAPSRSPLEVGGGKNFLVDEEPGQACLRCGGIWVRRAAWTELVRAAEAQVAADFDPGKVVVAVPGGRRESIVVRGCPQCRRGMVKQDYGRRSGVRVDVCYWHGVWLDGGELAAVRAFIASGGLVVSRSEVHERDDFQRWEELWSALEV
jgi:Zn-finger nucleic acid-binding protein